MSRALIMTVLLLAGAGLALADAPRIGVVTGTVSGPDGAPMPGATVQLQSERGTMTRVTGAEGEFRFVFVMPGSYTVRADLQGFQPTAGEIEVESGGRTDIELALGEQMGEEIVVTGEVPLINKYDVSGGGSLARDELATVLPGRFDYQGVLFLYPGAALSEQQGGADVEGMQPVRMAMFVDGVDVNFVRYGGSTRLSIPTTALTQVKLEASGSDAEYSRGVGGVSSVIVRSGTNAFHGEAQVILSNQSWNSQYELFPIDQVDKLDNQFELTLGGPILRDRLFFFAAYADHGAYVQRTIPDGSLVEYDTESENSILKLDFRPSASHSLAFTAIDNPTAGPYWGATDADIYAAVVINEGGDMYSLKWGWAISDDLLLDSHVAVQQTDNEYTEFARRDVDPGAPASSPAANPTTIYYDANTRLEYNASSFTWGIGPNNMPRDQANVSLNGFFGEHDLKVGVDWQDVSYDQMSSHYPWAYGRGYNPMLPGGFTNPIIYREYLSPAGYGGSRTTAEVYGLFARDRFAVGDHWTFNVGLRLDKQEHQTDVGKTTIDSTDYSPRIAVAYDLWGDSKLLLTASAGRYIEFPGVEFTAQFNEVPTTTVAYDQYAWNRTTQAYDILNAQVRPGATDIIRAEPNRKDEYSLGAEWAFSSNWAAKLKLLYWDQPDLKAVTDQFDSTGALIRSWGHIPGTKAERTSATLIVRRRFKDNWFVSGSYAYSKTEGTCYLSVLPGFNCRDNYGELMTGVNPATGQPFPVPVSVVNRDGRIFVDKPHVLRAMGSYLLPLGSRSSLLFSGTAWFQSGMAYEHAQTTTVNSISGITSSSIEYLEPAGSRRLDDLWQIDLSLAWRFRFLKDLEGFVRLEGYNLTDEQVRYKVSDQLRLTLDPSVGLNTSQIQNPRSYRALVGLSF